MAAGSAISRQSMPNRSRFSPISTRLMSTTNFPSSLPFRIRWISSGMSILSPRQASQPTSMRFFRPASITIFAASPSCQMLNSAAAVTFPPPKPAPPMTTTRPAFFTVSGSSRSARARLVRGPRVMMSISPSPLSRRASSIRQTPCPSPRRSRSGARPRSPMPSCPWVS